MDSVIYLTPTKESNSFTNLSFYSILLEQLEQHYTTNSTPPILSIEKLEWIEPSSIPNIIGLGYFLKQRHGKMIEFRMSYNPQLLHYLNEVGFFRLVGKQSPFTPEGLEIYDYNDKLIGGFSAYGISEKRKAHRIHSYAESFDYHLLKNEMDREFYRDDLIEKLEYYILPQHFGVVLRDKEITGKNLEDSYERLAEPISNGILHSFSPSFVMIQTTKFRTKISITDVGIGFENSLKRKDIELDLISIIKSKNAYISRLHDFYMIQQILIYSMSKLRTGLLDFIIDVVSKNSGTVRIHYNSTQIIITPKFLPELSIISKNRQEMIDLLLYGETKSGCRDYAIIYQKALISIMELGNRIRFFFKNEYRISPIRLYNVGLQGVHIEIDLI